MELRHYRGVNGLDFFPSEKHSNVWNIRREKTIGRKIRVMDMSTTLIGPDCKFGPQWSG
jgi:hypothetical protein